LLLYNGLVTVTNSLAWNGAPNSIESLSAFTSYIDGLFGAVQGVRTGYLTVTVSANIGLPSNGHFFMAMANSEGFRICIAFSVAADRIKILTKTSGKWGTVWKTFSGS